jgi:hypothetical protein
MRGPYARRTEIKRDETREQIRANRTDASEAKACEETIDACNAFLESRGYNEGNHTRITLNLVNVRVRERQAPRSKAQDPLPTKSLKAAVLREIVMEARRRGVIRDGYAPKVTREGAGCDE